MSQGRVAALGSGFLCVARGSVGKLNVPSQGQVMREIGGRNWCAASPLQRFLLSLGVEGHVVTIKTSGHNGPEEENIMFSE